MTNCAANPMLILCVCMFLVGCRAKPAPDAGFLEDPKLMTASNDVPFNRAWANPKYREKRYVEIYVAPVNTGHVMAQNVWEKATLASVSHKDVEKNVQMLADYLRNAFVTAAQRDPTNAYRVVDHPGPDTLILEMAIVQLAPSKSELQAASYVTWIPSAVMMGASAVTRSEDQGKGVIAIEARTRDGATGEITGMFADREHPPAAIVDLKSLFWWESAKPICDGWARQFMAMQTSPKGKKIDKIPNFKLLVW